MKRNIGILAGVVVLVSIAALLPGCGFKRQLVSITVSPTGTTILGAGLTVQFKAVGNYIHPPDSRDITNSVVWQSAIPQAISITATGLATSGTACGTDIPITATAHSDPTNSSSGIVIGVATANVKQPPPGPQC